MDKIIALPLLISAICLLERKPAEVFMWVFLPFLTMVPTYYDWKVVSGIPELHFWSAALIPIIVAWMINNLGDYKFHWMDLVIVSYIGVIFLGHLSNNSYAHAQKYGFRNVLAMFFPYIIARSITQDKETLVKLLKMMTMICAVVAVFNIIEFRMVVNHFDTHLRRLWPHYVVYDYGMMLRRWGFKRALGPFSHPIIAGNIFAMVTPLAVWCHYYGYYRNKLIGLAIIALNLGGVMVSISRAPIAACFMAVGIVYYGWSNQKAVIRLIGGSIFLILLLVTVPKFVEYASISPDRAKTSEQRNVALRWTMWKSYAEIVMEKPWLGWGIGNIPAVEGLIDSIDAEYLGVALTSGIIALMLYLTFLLGTFARILYFAHSKPYDDPWARLGWCILAGWLSTVLSLATVYAGAQSVHYLFIIGAVVHVLITTDSSDGTALAQSGMPLAAPQGPFNFQRTI